MTACKEQVNVDVRCKTTAESTIECDVQQTVGTAEVDACWDLKITCENGAIVTTPRNCQKVKDGKTEKYTVTKDKLIGVAQCGGSAPPKMEMLKMSLNGEDVEMKPLPTDKPAAGSSK